MLRTHNCGELSGKQAGEKVVLCGWIDALRIQGKIGFMLLRDREGITQIFLNLQLAKEFGNLSKESVVLVEGEVKKRPDNQVKKEMSTGEIEVSASKIEILSQAETPLPIEIAEDTTTNLDKRLDYRFLDLRRRKISAIFKIRSQVAALTYEFFVQEGFISIQTPKLTKAGVESGAEEFKIDYFGKKASLAQSPQIYKQMFVVSGLEKVFELGTIFRAEKSHTTRHLTEFTGIDFEMAFIKDEHDIMDVIEKYLRFLLEGVNEECKNELKVLNVKLNIPLKIPRLHLDEMRKLLKTKGKLIPHDEDLDAEAEKLMGEIVKEKYKCDFFFALGYPWKKRPFYHMKPYNDTETTKSFDLVYNGVEIATGAQREHRLDILERQCREKGLDLKRLEFYREIFRYGAPPHGGVGLGLDRIIEQMLNLGNVREAILLPRDPERLTP